MDDAIQRLRDNISAVYLGNPEAVERVLCCLLARGHLLIEDVPGVGKTILAHALARSIDCEFSRIQLTPDMLPADILGVSILDRTDNSFEFKRGPIFASIVLADEINRTPPRTQSALLEAMNEGTVTIDGHLHVLPRPFMLVATQNPFDLEGTYPLPENQLDRFLMRVHLGYPDREDEARVLELRPSDIPLADMRPCITGEDLVSIQDQVDRVRVDRSLVDYTIDFAHHTRNRGELRMGLSTRGALSLMQAARATAICKGRDYVIPDDIINNIVPVCAHRVMPNVSHNGTMPVSTTDLLMGVVESIDVPR